MRVIRVIINRRKNINAFDAIRDDEIVDVAWMDTLYQIGERLPYKNEKERMPTNYHSTWRIKKRYRTQYIKTGQFIGIMASLRKEVEYASSLSRFILF